MGNLARFTIDNVASDPPGFDAAPNQELTLRLEAPTGVLNRWSVQVYDAANPEAPLASKSAPALTLAGATSGSSVDAATVGSAITTRLPNSRAHSWVVRSLVNGGINALGRKDPDYVFERVVSIRTTEGMRKVVQSEGVAYSEQGSADAQNEIVDLGAPPAGAGAALEITTVVVANVADLTHGPTANGGYTIQNGDLVALAEQTNPAHDLVYLVSVASGVASYSPRSPQPQSGTLLTATKAAAGQTLWVVTTDGIEAAGQTVGVYQGAHTTTNVAPDADRLKWVDNPGIPGQSIPFDGAWHPVASFDFVGRSFTSGRVKLVGCAWAIDGAHECEMNLRANVTCSATPTAGAVPATSQLDTIDDAGGAGGYADMRYFVVSTRVELQVKNLQPSGPITFVGLIGEAVGQ